jgi:hypothetical protein
MNPDADLLLRAFSSRMFSRLCTLPQGQRPFLRMFHRFEKSTNADVSLVLSAFSSRRRSTPSKTVKRARTMGPFS